MSMGSYLSGRTVREMERWELEKEGQKMRYGMSKYLTSLRTMLHRDSWPKSFADEMSKVAAESPEIMINEMAYRKMTINPHDSWGSASISWGMLVAYVVGGIMPLSPYLFLSVRAAIPCSIVASLLGLFVLGVVTARFTGASWWRSGGRMMILAGTTALVGFIVGRAIEWLRVG